MKIEEYSRKVGHPELLGYLRRGLTHRGVFIPLIYMDMVGNNGNDAILLSQILYFFDCDDMGNLRASHKYAGEIWVVKTFAEWSDSTGIKARTVRDSLDRLQSIGLIVKEQHRSTFPEHKGAVVAFVRVNWNTYFRMLTENAPVPLTDSVESDLTDSVESGATDSVESYTETTTESDTNTNTASADKSTATQDNRYTRNRITVVGTPEESSHPTHVDVSTLPAYIQLLLQTTRSKWKNLSNAMKAKAHAAMKAWDDDTAGYIDTKSPIEMYDTHAVYAAWVREIIVPEMQKQTGNRVNKGKFIEQTSNYIRFQKWLKSEHGKAFMQKQHVTTIASDKPAETIIIDMPEGYIS